MTYVEFPFDQIIDLHVKKKDEPPDGGPDYGGACGSGWFPFGAYFPGGNGFPAQIVPDQPTNMSAGGGVLWNPEVTPAPPDDQPWLYIIPGSGSTAERISIVWRGVLSGGPGAGPPLLAGLWIMPPGHRPLPPYLDDDGNPPPNPPPYNPDISGDVVGDGRITWEGTEGATVVAGFASTTARAARPPLVPSPRRRIVRPRFRADTDVTHYGWPGDPPTDGIWIEVEHDCPDS